MYRSVALFALVTLVSSAAFGATEKNARQGDVASKYVLDDGRLYRVVNGNNCDITTGVEDFKVSQHPNDKAMIYFKKAGDLYALLNTAAPSAGTCPKATKSVLLKGVKKYNVVSSTDTTLVNTALSTSGAFRAGKNSGPAYRQTAISDYALNTCYNQQGKSFSTYVAFLLKDNGEVVRVKGKTPEDSKVVAGRYTSLNQFKTDEKVCQ